MTTSYTPDPQAIDDLLGRLTLERKVQLLTGRDFWTTWPLEEIGLRRMLVSDGPSGVRGEVWDERDPSLNLPSATALAASWDTDVAHRYGAAAAAEARRKGVDVVLGPTINLHRSPLGGRHFEAFSEDPILTARLAAAYVTGVQDQGVGATPKHYVANDFETDRFTVDVRVDERTLHEVYLRAFVDAVVDARAWLVMSAYNSINGATASENDLLETPLNTDWGFDGVVISDWTAVRSLDSARASQDLVMPGPDGPWGDALVEAVRTGDIDEALVDRKVRRLLVLAARVGALDGFEPPAPAANPVTDGIAFTREAAAEGMVLVRNTGLLPLDGPTRLAVIGHNARQARTQGGGSATVLPETVISPWDGLREAFPDAELTYSLGAVAQEGLAELERDQMRNPVTGDAGARVSMLDADGTELFAEDRLASGLVWFGGDAPIGRLRTLVFETDYTATETGPVGLGFAGVGTGRVIVDGEQRLERRVDPVGTDLGAALLAPPSASTEVELTAGATIRLRVEFEPMRPEKESLIGALGITIGTEPPAVDPDELIAQAAEAAAAADVAVVVVGTNSRVESEGHDRTDLTLPGRQDDLVRAVTAANPRTIVVVNSGAPVLLPWRDESAAVLLTWFGGQEYGHALGDVLTGAREPGGRLPTTWPAAEADVPVLDVTPVDGAVTYDEGVHLGHRAWLRAGRAPAYGFGHGLGYTDWELSDTRAELDGQRITVTATVANVGDRDGKHVVQVYAAKPDSAVDRPARWLVGWTVVRAAAGERGTVSVDVPVADLQHWDGGWRTEPGEYELHVGRAVDAIEATVTVTLTDDR